MQCVIVVCLCVLLSVQEERRAQLPRYQRLIPPRPGPTVAGPVPPAAAVGALPPQRHPMHGELLMYQIGTKWTPTHLPYTCIVFKCTVFSRIKLQTYSN